MKHILLITIVLTLSFQRINADTTRIAFLNGRTNQGFWGDVEKFMMEVAEDFADIELTIYRAESNHIKQLQILETITSREYPTKYDAVITRTLKENGVELLQLAQKSKIPLFLFNSGLTDQQITKYGGPRETFSTFIGEMYPNDSIAGYESVDLLFQHAQKKGLLPNEASGKLRVLAIAGGYRNIASNERIKGFEQFTAEHSEELELLQITHVHEINTMEEMEIRSQKIMNGMELRYGPINLVWAYNDGVAIGVIKAVLKKANTSIPGETFLCGGIDWTPDAIDLIQSGEMLYSFGGHYMDGGWSLIAVYDYLNGKDFKDSEAITSFQTRLSVINRENVEDYIKLFVEDNIHIIDFTRFSKVKNPDLVTYDFGLETLLHQMNNRK